jgi:hypothetical protein
MNIVDLISSQLSGDVLGKLGGLIGADDSQTKSATSAAVPALLNVFSKLASTNSGADQLAKAMGGLDLGMLGNLAGALGGSQASGLGSLGGNLLGSLLGGGGGGNNLSSLVGALASFAGMQPGIMKTLLTYLAPIVLGMRGAHGRACARLEGSLLQVLHICSEILDARLHAREVRARLLGLGLQLAPARPWLGRAQRLDHQLPRRRRPHQRQLQSRYLLMRRDAPSARERSASLRPYPEWLHRLQPRFAPHGGGRSRSGMSMAHHAP